MKTRGEYNTKSQALIKECLLECGHHLTAEQITEKLCDNGQKIGRTTVYRALQKLVSKGEACRHSGGDSFCYSLAGDNCKEHFHLKCSACGKLIHLECSHLSDISQHVLSHHGFELDRLNTVLSGLCGECRR